MANITQSNETAWRADGGRAFTTGAYVEAVEIDGEWRWIVSGFEDDTFFDGKTLNVNQSAENRDDLVTVDDDKEEPSSYLDFLARRNVDYIDIVPQD